MEILLHRRIHKAIPEIACVYPKKKAEEPEQIFRENPFYPSLHTEKLEPKGKQVWSFRVDRSYRILFKFIEADKVVFLTVGPHDWIYKLPF